MKAIPKQYLERLCGFDLDPQDNSVMVTLAYGWRFSDSYAEDPSHVKGFDNAKQAVSGLKETEPCSCKDCINHQ